MKLYLFIICAFIQLYSSYSSPRVVCYWANWHHSGLFKHSPEDIDATLCTHIHYSFALLDEENATLIDSEGSPQTKIYKKLNELKNANKDLKVILSLGGWGDDGGKYSRVVADEYNRTKLVNNTIEYLHEYGFDGLDIDWEFPVCWQAKCGQGHEYDKNNFNKLLEELRTEFDKQNPKLLLSAAVHGSESLAKQAYDIKGLGKNLDYVNVMTYDYAGEWDHMTGHHSPFQLSKAALQFYEKNGIPKDKLLMGVPFFGHSFTLKDADNHTVGAPITGAGKKLPSGETGSVYYWEICQFVKNDNWTKEASDGIHDPITYKGDQWIGYDDPNQAYVKSLYVRDNGYGGIIIWEISADDVHKRCCTVAYPMLQAINFGLFGKGENPFKTSYGCE